MAADSQPPTLPERLATAWPIETWRDVHVIAAVSGGTDSVALLRALAELKLRAGGAGRVIVGHVNHQLRVPGADEDEAWVRQQCAQLGLACEVRRAARGTKPQAASEDAARTERYRFLREIAEEAGARFVATAHTRDDQAETVLFRLARGSGLRGLAGMRRSRPLSASVMLVRPLLDCSRSDVRGYLDQIGQSWREDATNADVRFARNRIRADMLPRLREAINSDADEAIVRAAEAIGEAQAMIESLAGKLLAECAAAASAGRVSLDVAPLAGQPRPLTIEALRLAWREAELPEQAMTRAWWLELAALATGAEESPPLNLPGHVTARRQKDILMLARASRLA